MYYGVRDFPILHFERYIRVDTFVMTTLSDNCFTERAHQSAWLSVGKISEHVEFVVFLAVRSVLRFQLREVSESCGNCGVLLEN